MTIDSVLSVPIPEPLSDAHPPQRRKYRFVQRLLILYAFVLPYELFFEAVGANLPTILKPSRVVGLVIVFLWMARTALAKRRRRLDVFDRGFILIMVLGILSALIWKLLDGQGDLRIALSDTTLTGFGFLIYLVVKHQMGEPEQARALLSAYIVGTVSSVLLAAPLLWNFSQGTRFKGYYDNPNSLAFAAAVCLLVLIGRLLFSSKARLGRNFARSSLVILLLATVMLVTGSRGMMVALAISVLVLNVPVRRLRATRSRKEQRLTQGISVACILLISAVVVGSTASRHSNAIFILRLTDPSESSTGNRLDLVESSFLVARDHYFLGVGTAQYRFYHREAFARLGNPSAPQLGKHEVGTHNAYMNLLTSNGVVGLTVYLVMLLGLYRALRRRVRSTDQTRPIIATYIPLLAFVAIAGVSSVLVLTPDYWLIMAILTAGVRAPSGTLTD